VAQIGEGARFKYVMQVYEEKKDNVLAAKEFKEFVAQYPGSEHAPRRSTMRCSSPTRRISSIWRSPPVINW